MPPSDSTDLEAQAAPHFSAAGGLFTSRRSSGNKIAHPPYDPDQELTLLLPQALESWSITSVSGRSAAAQSSEFLAINEEVMPRDFFGWAIRILSARVFGLDQPQGKKLRG